MNLTFHIVEDVPYTKGIDVKKTKEYVQITYSVAGKRVTEITCNSMSTKKRLLKQLKGKVNA